MEVTNTNENMISFVIIDMLPYLYELATIVAGPCIFMTLLKYRAVILTFAWWQILLGFGVGISVVVAIGNIFCRDLHDVWCLELKFTLHFVL